MKNTHFVLGILFAIFLAKLTPSIGRTGGILRPEITVKYFAVFIIFLNSGLTLPSEDLTSAFLQWDLHLFVQSFTFLVVPAIVGLLVLVLRYSFIHTALLDGITILSTMPPPVSSAIILTNAVGGNEGAAVFNSVLGSMLGIIVTPFLILLLLGTKEGEVPTHKIFSQLFMTVAVPLVIGQVIRKYNYRRLQLMHIPFRTIGLLLILFIIYTTFCDTFSRTDFQLKPSELVAIIILMISLLLAIKCFLLMTSYYLFGYNAEDAISIMFVGAHKNLALGIPVIEIIFEGSPYLSFYSIPLLIYNPAQIVLGALSIGVMQQWLATQRQKRRVVQRRRRPSPSSRGSRC